MKHLRIQRNQNLRQSDFLIIALVTALVIFGVVMVFSASYYKSINSSGTPYAFLRKQGVFAIAGFMIMAFFSKLDYHILGKFSKVIFWVGVALLVLVMTPLGSSENNATRAIWIGFTIMPGEIAKITTLIYVAAFLAKEGNRILSFKNGVLPLLGIMLLVGGLIIIQPNLSTALTVCGIVAGMMFIAGLQWRYVIGALGTFGVAVAFLVIFGGHIGGGHWKKRIISFMDPFADKLGDGYQVVQSLLALGSGGLSGVGLGKSVQKTLYLPEPQNDFILAIIGEELGLIGVLLLLTVYLVLIWRCFHVCLNAKDRFGMYLSGGITIMLGLQVIFNVAVVTSSMPPTGVILPFISYGGNSLWLFMAAMGMVLSVSRQSNISNDGK